MGGLPLFKIVYDFHQLPRESIPQLRDTLLSLVATYAKGPKPIRTQLSVCLANVAIQMLEWKDVLPMVVSALGSDPNSIACLLEFLHVLPEEVTEGRKINLTVRPTEHVTYQTTPVAGEERRPNIVVNRRMNYEIGQSSFSKTTVRRYLPCSRNMHNRPVSPIKMSISGGDADLRRLCR